MITHNCEQRSDEWMQLHYGKFTASNFGKLFMGKSTLGYNDLINEVVYKRITLESPEDSFKSYWMERGIELEPEAIKAYEILTFNKVNKVGFIELNEWVGCSPDGEIGKDELLEVKCPKYTTLINYHLNGMNDKDYICQMQGELYITGRKRCTFFAYHPKLKPFIKIFGRDEKLIIDIEIELAKAIELAKKRIELIK